MDAQVVLISSPGLGHLIPVIELGRRFLIHHNFKVTILAVSSSHSSGAEAQVLNPAATTNDDHHINIIQIPSPDISSLIDAQATAVTRLCVMMRAAIPAIRHSLSSIITHPSTLIVDIFGTECLPLAKEFNMLNNYTFVASHAWFLSLLIYSPYLDKQVKGQYVDQKEPLKIPGCRPVRPEDVIDPMLDRNDKQYEEFLEVGNRIPKGDGMLMNTWECLQPLVLGSLREEDLLGRILKGPVYCVGPLVRQPNSVTQGTIEARVVKWLDKQPSESVIYVSFGSGGTMSYEQTTELAWGLELSGQRFVWVVRPPTVGPADSAFFTTGSGDNSDEEMEQMSKYLPKGFLSRTLNVGFMVSQWAPQVVILRHPSVGGFLSHCGWNSALESLTNGVPMIAWPLYAEQRMNATLLAEELGVAVRPEVLPAKRVVGREEIAWMVRRIMVVDDKVGENPIRERVREIKHGAVEALSKGGSSIAALSQVAKTMVMHAE